MGVYAAIQKIRDDIFVNNYSDVFYLVTQIMEHLEKQISLQGNTDARNKFNLLLKFLTECMVNEDYLLLSDILQYEALPLFESLGLEME